MDRFSYLAEMRNGALGVAWYKFVRLKNSQARDCCVASNRKPTIANNKSDFLAEKSLSYCWVDLHILTYLLTAVKPIVTGEVKMTNRLKKA